MENQKMAELFQEIDDKLKNVFHLRTVPMCDQSEQARMEVVASLLYLYNESWAIDSANVIIGVHSNNSPELFKKPAVVKKFSKWLTLAELGHLIPEGSSITNAKRFPRLVTSLMDKVERRHGTAGLGAKVRMIVQKEARKAVSGANQPKAKTAEQRATNTSSSNNSVQHELHDQLSTSITPTRTIPSGKQLPRTPSNLDHPSVPENPNTLNDQPNGAPGAETPDDLNGTDPLPAGFIPGKQIPRTPPRNSSANTSVETTLNESTRERICSFYSPVPSPKLSKRERIRRAPLISASEFNLSEYPSPQEENNAEGIKNSSTSVTLSPSPPNLVKRLGRRSITQAPISASEFDDISVELTPKSIIPPSGKQLARTPVSAQTSVPIINEEVGKPTQQDEEPMCSTWEKDSPGRVSEQSKVTDDVESNPCDKPVNEHCLVEATPKSSVPISGRQLLRTPVSTQAQQLNEDGKNTKYLNGFADTIPGDIAVENIVEEIDGMDKKAKNIFPTGNQIPNTPHQNKIQEEHPTKDLNGFADTIPCDGAGATKGEEIDGTVKKAKNIIPTGHQIPNTPHQNRLQEENTNEIKSNEAPVEPICNKQMEKEIRVAALSAPVGDDEELEIEAELQRKLVETERLRKKLEKLKKIEEDNKLLEEEIRKLAKQDLKREDEITDKEVRVDDNQIELNIKEKEKRGKDLPAMKVGRIKGKNVVNVVEVEKEIIKSKINDQEKQNELVGKMSKEKEEKATEPKRNADELKMSDKKGEKVGKRKEEIPSGLDLKVNEAKVEEMENKKVEAKINHQTEQKELVGDINRAKDYEKEKVELKRIEEGPLIKEIAEIKEKKVDDKRRTVSISTLVKEKIMKKFESEKNSKKETEIRRDELSIIGELEEKTREKKNKLESKRPEQETRKEIESINEEMHAKLNQESIRKRNELKRVSQAKQEENQHIEKDNRKDELNKQKKAKQTIHEKEEKKTKNNAHEIIKKKVPMQLNLAGEEKFKEHKNKTTESEKVDEMEETLRKRDELRKKENQKNEVLKDKQKEPEEKGCEQIIKELRNNDELSKANKSVEKSKNQEPVAKETNEVIKMDKNTPAIKEKLVDGKSSSNMVIKKPSISPASNRVERVTERQESINESIKRGKENKEERKKVMEKFEEKRNEKKKIRIGRKAVSTGSLEKIDKSTLTATAAHAQLSKDSKRLGGIAEAKIMNTESQQIPDVIIQESVEEVRSQDVPPTTNNHLSHIVKNKEEVVNVCVEELHQDVEKDDHVKDTKIGPSASLSNSILDDTEDKAKTVLVETSKPKVTEILASNSKNKRESTSKVVEASPAKKLNIDNGELTKSSRPSRTSRSRKTVSYCETKSPIVKKVTTKNIKSAEQINVDSEDVTKNSKVTGKKNVAATKVSSPSRNSNIVVNSSSKVTTPNLIERSKRCSRVSLINKESKEGKVIEKSSNVVGKKRSATVASKEMSPPKKPTIKVSTPKPITKASTSKTTSKVSTPKPTTKVSTPKPTTKVSTPKLTTKVSTPKPTTKASTPEVIGRPKRNLRQSIDNDKKNLKISKSADVLVNVESPKTRIKATKGKKDTIKLEQSTVEERLSENETGNVPTRRTARNAKKYLPTLENLAGSCSDGTPSPYLPPKEPKSKKNGAPLSKRISSKNIASDLPTKFSKEIAASAEVSMDIQIGKASECPLGKVIKPELSFAKEKLSDNETVNVPTRRTARNAKKKFTTLEDLAGSCSDGTPSPYVPPKEPKSNKTASKKSDVPTKSSKEITTITDIEIDKASDCVSNNIIESSSDNLSSSTKTSKNNKGKKNPDDGTKSKQEDSVSDDKKDTRTRKQVRPRRSVGGVLMDIDDAVYKTPDNPSAIQDEFYVTPKAQGAFGPVKDEEYATPTLPVASQAKKRSTRSRVKK